MKTKLLLLGLFSFLVVASGCSETCPPSAVYGEDHERYGRYEAPGFDNACSSNADCLTGGCGGEVCAAEAVLSTCDVIEPPEGICGCLEGTCVWATTECRDEGRPNQMNDSGPGPDGSEAAMCALPEGCETPPDAGTRAEASVEGLEIMSRLAGLWTGPATRTPLGDFQFMNVDFRPVADSTLLGRVDLDRENGLIFAFAIETHGGQDVLVYRNGGYFLGIFRDHRTELVERTDDSWRFCHIGRGCDYIDARFELDEEDRLVFEVVVLGRPHLQWEARRAEDRAVSEPFPENQVSRGDGSNDYPPMPTHRVSVKWSTPLPTDADLWVLLPTSPCLSPSECVPARTSFVRAAAGTTQADVPFDMIHPGAYYAMVVLDRNQNFLQTFFPDSGDGVGLPNERVDVEQEGSSVSQLRIIASVP